MPIAMEKLQFNVPDLWADHHVLRVRAALDKLAPAVQNVVASSAFRIVAVEYDPAAVSREQIQSALAEAGYPVASEPGAVNPVVPVQTRRADPAWARLGFRVKSTDPR